MSDKQKFIERFNNYHFVDESDRSKYEDKLSKINDCLIEDVFANTRLTVDLQYLNAPIYMKYEDQRMISYSIVSNFEFKFCSLFHNEIMSFNYDKEKHYFYKKTPLRHRNVSINLIDYLEDKIAHEFVRSTVEKYYPKDSLKLLDEIEKSDYAYRISINTILNSENKTLSDVITTRNKFEFPELQQNNNLITAMIARDARKEITEEYYSDFLDYLSTIKCSHHIYSCLRDMKDLAVYDYLYKKIFNVDLSERFNYDINHFRSEKEKTVREKNFYLSSLLNNRINELNSLSAKCA